MAVPWLEKRRTERSAYRDAKTNRVITWDKALAKVLTLQHIERGRSGRARYLFALEGYPGTVYIRGRYTATTLPDLTLILEDDTVRSLKAEYEGKQVWCPGGPGAAVIWFRPGEWASMNGPVTVPIRIRRIERIRENGVVLNYGYSDDPRCGPDPCFDANNPLVVLLDIPEKGLILNNWSASGHYQDDSMVDREFARLSEHPRNASIGLWYMVADRWDFERRYHLQPPWNEHPEWPWRMVRAIKEGHLVKGMTPEMVVWVWGWPPMRGSIKELAAESEWQYPGGTARAPSLVFRHGKFDHVYAPPSP